MLGSRCCVATKEVRYLWSCRWCNQLNPEVRKEPFSEEEDRALLAAHEKYGNKWAAIAKELPGR